MALVMLPCDFPWWPRVKQALDKAASARNSADLLDAMLKIHDMCNISLDPDLEEPEPDIFEGLGSFLDKDLDDAEREQMFTRTIPWIAQTAKRLKDLKPKPGFHFSLQQQGDTNAYSYGFAASLIANAFFSTFPKRTLKTHPTLRDFNFTHFFEHLDKNSQKAKLKCILRYFDFLERNKDSQDGHVVISRRVMTATQWLTIEDWLESSVPLCPLTIRHEGRLERVENESRVMHVCFGSARFGGGVLEGGVTQETVQIATHPELLTAIPSVEALEDNEILLIEGVRHIARIHDPRNKAIFELVESPNPITVCCIDPEDYSRLPISQFEEDNILRELNKTLLGFRQGYAPSSPTDPVRSSRDEQDSELGSRRLSPIGESFSSTPPELDGEEKGLNSANAAKHARLRSSNETKASTSLNASSNASSSENRARPNGKTRSASPRRNSRDPSTHSSRSRFIVLGSSGDILPVTRRSLGQLSVYSSCNSQSTDSYHSARDTIDEEPEDEDQPMTTSDRRDVQNETERRGTFAQRLKEALKRESTATAATSSQTSSESSCPDENSRENRLRLDENVGTEDRLKEPVIRSNEDNGTEKTRSRKHAFKLKRDGSRGFVLRDDDLTKEPDRFFPNLPTLQRRDTNASSRYSFSTEYNSEFCSELAEVYEQLAKWLEDPISTDESRELDPRDQAVVNFAGSLLKRALSESFAGVPVQEGEPHPLIDSVDINQRRKIALAVRSLSLELARHKIKKQQSVSDTEDIFEDALNEDLFNVNGTSEWRHRRLRAVAFTSEMYQTLVDDQTTVCLPKTDETKTKRVQANSINSKLVGDLKKCHLEDIPHQNSLQAGGLLPVATGNWGCGSRLKGDPQLKLVIQWMAASLAGVPRLIYYTAGNQNLSKLDTVSRVLIDRHWTVGDLATATLRFAIQAIEDRIEGRNSLFEDLIGMDKPSP